MRVPAHVPCPHPQQCPPHLHPQKCLWLHLQQCPPCLRTRKHECLHPCSLFPLSPHLCFQLIQCLLLQCACAWTHLNSCGCGCGLSVDYIDIVKYFVFVIHFINNLS